MQVDVDGNGTIEFPEFLELMKMKAKEVKIEYFDQKYRQRHNGPRRSAQNLDQTPSSKYASKFVPESSLLNINDWTMSGPWSNNRNQIQRRKKNKNRL